MYKVIKTDSNIVRPLRHKVLRPNLSYEASIMPLDNHPETAHFVVKKNSKILSVASVYHEDFEEMPHKISHRLRGMATEPTEQGKGFGAMVLLGLIDYLKKNTSAEILWCNARVTAFGFYEKMGFSILGDIFEIPNIGPHKKGYIEL
ncbi:MAG: GNAT family N-acetyltransferase [Candidatus Marinimicrobia bacterium]|jgi:hypothetical protein|nr:GNAT family N-acetyltransferase [Candidatus Neomarinimicrobiota bacterium]MBT5760013.1 GNAT family N-acetyltransferase [Candidatus Neomarinimicrobiota bacterium]